MTAVLRDVTYRIGISGAFYVLYALMTAAYAIGTPC
jgi:hypothetical protein